MAHVDQGAREAAAGSHRRDVVWLFGVGLAYFLAHGVAFLFPDSARVLMAVWPPGGIALAAALRTPRARWPHLLATLFATGILADALAGRSLVACVGFMAANVLETAACAWVTVRICRGSPTFRRVRDVLALVSACIVVNGATALLGAATAHAVDGVTFLTSWRTWWIGDGLGLLLVTPLLIAWTDTSTPRIERPIHRALEFAVFAVLWSAVAWHAFESPANLPVSSVRPYLLLALLVWPSLRLGLRAVAVALLILGIFALTSHGVRVGPLIWGQGDFTYRLFLAQMFVGVVAVVGLIQTAVHAETTEAMAVAREEQARIRALGDNLPGGTIYQVVLDRDGKRRFLHLGGSLERLYGVSAAAVLEDPSLLYDRIIPEDRPALAAAEDRSAKELSTLDAVFRLRDLGDRIRSIHLSASPRLMADGRVVWDGIETDVTELLAAQAALRESEEKFAKVFHQAPVLIIISDLDSGAVLEMNDAALMTLGYSREEAEGRSAVESGWLSEEDQARIVAEMQRNGGRVKGFEVNLRTRSGSHRIGLLNGEQMTVGARRCMLLVATDITEQKQVQTDLALSEGRFRRLFEGSPLGIVIVNKQRQVVLTNESYRSLLGLTHQEIVERGMRRVRHPDDLPEGSAQAERVRSGVVPRAHFEERHVRGDGAIVPCDINLTAIHDTSGELLEMIGWVQDLSERKRAEAERTKLQEQLAHAQKMESIGRLAGGVAHDFNNMLGVILGHVELAMDAMDPNHPAMGELEGIDNAAERSATLTRQLLAFARKQTIAPKVMDINEAVARSLKMLQRLVGENITIEWNPGAYIGAVKMDPSQVDQILANLCVNARDAISAVGTITMSTENVDARPEDYPDTLEFKAGEYVRIRVRDNGCGIDPATLARIFEPYFTTKSFGKGTGLGLATVYGTVRQNGGYVIVTSSVGQGATFDILLPRHAKAVSQASDGAPLTLPRPSLPVGPRILVVEDQPNLLTLAARILSKHGFRVLPAGGPVEALGLSQIHAGEIDLLLTDVVMPEMNGRELALKIQAQQPRMRTLFMSGYSDDIIAKHMVLEEGLQFLAKPFSATDLVSKIHAVLATASQT